MNFPKNTKAIPVTERLYSNIGNELIFRLKNPLSYPYVQSLL
jgi:hypothetical protein